ncbi:DUF695 domain-containing protein [Dactylosporangium sp. CA-139114]|uniref:DUF695 domain-containing protein n=1 Tax=Dactylosporangium sp. CA-139114 TaxID=3239931 RepID=UPI003D98C676
MIFGRSKRKAGDPGAIVDFWTWWPTVRADVEAAIGSGNWATLTPQMSRRIEAIHPELEWEFCRGTAARHALVVSAGGAADLRPVAARWGALAPEADATWEYHTARQPDPHVLEQTIGLGEGVQLDLTQLRFAFQRDERSPEIDVVAFHPGFRMLGDEFRGRVTFLTLDWLLGEDGVEEWIGDITWQTTQPDGAADPRELAAAVEALREEFRTSQWVLLRGETPGGGPVIVAVQRPLRAVRWPRFDTHVAITLPYRHRTDAGLPEAESLAALRDFEDSALTTAAGADGALLAHETSDGARTLHYYVDADSPAADDLAEAAGWWKDGRARVERHFDPSLERIGRFR